MSVSGVTFTMSTVRGWGIMWCRRSSLLCSDLLAHGWLSWFANLTSAQKIQVQSPALSVITFWDFFIALLQFLYCIYTLSLQADQKHLQLPQV